ncbi:hypothetical protein CEXT_763701 [Caerostris extrusa]|uniref:Uncharacterized protein n=1 Tax=Caerostris extrusa TaxID=172846 RepID=A0AAV4WCG5_CAEEX|nr:hypothetical protein CEXT_763701 [Caerostris extrusa]
MPETYTKRSKEIGKEKSGERDIIRQKELLITTTITPYHSRNGEQLVKTKKKERDSLKTGSSTRVASNDAPCLLESKQHPGEGKGRESGGPRDHLSPAHRPDALNPTVRADSSRWVVNHRVCSRSTPPTFSFPAI